jgi:microcystin-dependent protein
MSDPFIGEVKLVGFNFAPFNWAICAGQLMPISQNSALFALLGTQYGGDGVSTYALPDLQGRAAGQVGPSLYTVQGLKTGTEAVSLSLSQYPAHSHPFNVNGTAASLTEPSNTAFLGKSTEPNIYAQAPGAPLQPLNNTGNAPVVGLYSGGSQPHENMMPYLTMNYIISLQGIFPARS